MAARSEVTEVTEVTNRKDFMQILEPAATEKALAAEEKAHHFGQGNHCEKGVLETKDPGGYKPQLVQKHNPSDGTQ